MTSYILIAIAAVAVAGCIYLSIKLKKTSAKLSTTLKDVEILTQKGDETKKEISRLTQSTEDLKTNAKNLKNVNATLSKQVDMLTEELADFTDGSDDDQLDNEVEETVTIEEEPNGVSNVETETPASTPNKILTPEDNWRVSAMVTTHAKNIADGLSIVAKARRVAAIVKSGLNPLEALDALVAGYHTNPDSLAHKHVGDATNKYYSKDEKGVVRTCLVGSACKNPAVFEDTAYEINGKTYDMTELNYASIDTLIREIGGIMNFLELLKDEFKIGITDFWKLGQMIHDNRDHFDENGLTPVGAYFYTQVRRVVADAFNMDITPISADFGDFDINLLLTRFQDTYDLARYEEVSMDAGNRTREEVEKAYIEYMNTPQPIPGLAEEKARDAAELAAHEEAVANGEVVDGPNIGSITAVQDTVTPVEEEEVIEETTEHSEDVTDVEFEEVDTNAPTLIEVESASENKEGNEVETEEAVEGPEDTTDDSQESQVTGDGGSNPQETTSGQQDDEDNSVEKEDTPEEVLTTEEDTDKDKAEIVETSTPAPESVESVETPEESEVDA